MENARTRISIWLVNVLLNYGRLSLHEISELWIQDEGMSQGLPMGRIKLQRAISSSFDILGVVIECDRRDGYRYYIAANENLKAAEWLISSQAVSRVLNESRNLSDHILLEDIPSGQFHLSTIISAMSNGKALEMVYQKFVDSEAVTSYVEPYCVKLSHQRWYLLACKDHRDHLQVFALDRIRQLRILSESDFTIPQDFSPQHYFEHYYGVHMGNGALPCPIIIRANRFWTNYLRTLPLHRSQREATPSADDCTVFEYLMAVTPDLINQLLSFGPGVEVLEPSYLRAQICDNIDRMRAMYAEK